MRQAGRYLPEYQKYVKKNLIIFNPKLACDISLQPIRFDFDFIILF